MLALSRRAPLLRSQLAVSVTRAWASKKPDRGGASAGAGAGPAANLLPPNPIDTTIGTPRVRDFVPVNVMKDGKDPKILADSEYPDWVFQLASTKPTVAQMELDGLDNLSEAERARYKKLKRRQLIKETNARTAK